MLLKEEKRDKAIVFFEEAYGIFHLGELAILTGMRLHRLPSHLGNARPSFNVMALVLALISKHLLLNFLTWTVCGIII